MEQAKNTNSEAELVNLTTTQLQRVAEIAALLGNQADPFAIQRLVLAQSAHIFNCKSGAIATWNDAEETLNPGPAVGDGHILQMFEYYSCRPIVEQILVRRKAVLISEPAKEVGKLAKDLGSIAAAPLIGAEGLLGILSLADKREGGFTTSEVQLLQVLANLCATSMETAGAFVNFKQQINERMTEVMADLKNTSIELDRVKSFNEDIFECISMGIVVIDRNFKITFRNRLGERLLPLGNSILEVLRRTSIGKDYSNWEKALREVVQEGKACRFADITYMPPEAEEESEGGKNAGPREIRLNLTFSPLISSGRGVVGGIITIENVTEQWLMESRLAVSERLAAVGRLAARVAHELNNPLDGVLRFIGLAQRASGKVAAEPAQAEQIRQYMDEAHKGVMRMARIIGDLLEFSRSTIAMKEKGQVCELLREAAETLAGQAARNHIQVKITCDPEIPALRTGNLYQVFLNLMKNGIEAMPDGGHLDIQAAVREGNLVITFQDSGAGIPPEVMPHIFEPFYTTKQTGRGTGLGLAICKDIVEKEDGKIKVVNRPEGGAVFTVQLPMPDKTAAAPKGG